MNIYEIKVKFGRNTDKGYGTQFSIITHAKGDKPYSLIINGILYKFLNQDFLHALDYDIVIEIDGVLIPTEYQYTNKSVAEVYTKVVNDNIDPTLVDILTKFINEIKERKDDEK